MSTKQKAQVIMPILFLYQMRNHRHEYRIAIDHTIDLMPAHLRSLLLK